MEIKSDEITEVIRQQIRQWAGDARKSSSDTRTNWPSRGLRPRSNGSSCAWKSGKAGRI
jgi:hypothetical protein